MTRKGSASQPALSEVDEEQGTRERVLYKGKEKALLSAGCLNPNSEKYILVK